MLSVVAGYSPRITRRFHDGARALCAVDRTWAAASRPHVLTDRLEIRAGDGSYADVTVVRRERPSVEFAPSYVHFGRVTEGQEGRLFLRILATDRQRFHVLDVRSDQASLEAQGPGVDRLAEHHTIALTLKAPDPGDSSAVAGDVLLQLDHPRMSELRIPWSAFVDRSTPPDMAFSPRISSDPEEVR